MLRKNFVFKIVPMLNPDGVRYGNYRCSLLGVDLNRRWDKPNKILHPTIYYTKKMIEVLNERQTVALFCDIHGHSRKHNVFMYGCSVRPTELIDQRRNFLAQLIPVLMTMRQDVFSYRDCRFVMEKSKAATARIVMYKDLGIINSYTLESTFFGPKPVRNRRNRHIDDKEL